LAYGRVLRPPPNAARGLIGWALALWPYINGKALTQHLNLKEMEASNMLDVIHFYLEEDFSSPSSEAAKLKSATREHFYREMYGLEYQFKIKDDTYKTKNFDVEDLPWDNEDQDGPDEDIKPFNPKKQPAKSYVPATPVSENSSLPFGGALDAPLK
jgi:hypothetical protein